MSLLRWIRGLLGSPPPARAASHRGPARSSDRRGAASRSTARNVARPAAPDAEASSSATAGLEDSGFFTVVNFDDARHRTADLRPHERELLERVDRRIAAGDLELPQLPSTSMAVMQLSSRPDVELTEIVERISSDPVLSSELLRTANSVLYAGHQPADTLREAVMRVGLRQLRSMIFAISMRSVILRFEALTAQAERVWRQSFSVASIARAIAPALGEDPERAFLIGLLHDVGKVALIAVLNGEAKKSSDVTPALLGRLFHDHHEPAELVAVAGGHHRFEQNEGHGRAAALASLAHRLDLFLSIGPERDYAAQATCRELTYLGVDPGAAQAILRRAAEAFVPDHEERLAA
jgi:HD-like signal output (HDOD) protein